jgi:rhodanese-related sulfurtransferase
MCRLLHLLIALALASVRGVAAEHTTDSLQTVRKKVADGDAVLVDVREEAEWKDGHLKSARLLPLSRIKANPNAEDVRKALPKGKPIYLHCAAGGRCRIAADLLKKDGYDLRPLKAGYDELLEAGFEKAAEKPTE